MGSFLTRFRLSGLIVLFAILISACGHKNASKTPDAAVYAEYIKAYTGGIVGEETEIRVDFTNDLTGEFPTEGLFRIQPPLDGTVKWNNTASVSFLPAEGALKAGQTYAISLNLGKLIAEAPETFDFGITVRKTEPEAEPVEEITSDGFSVKTLSLSDNHIDIVFNGAPVNASTKGMVELDGVSRSYLDVKDSLLRISFEGRKEEITLTLDANIKNAAGETLGSDFVRRFSTAEEKPAVQIPLSGNILPDRSNLILPFRAVNLSAVEVRIVKIYQKNVLMFLQDNYLGGRSELRRSGRLVYKGDIPLDASKDLHKWNDHSIDLSGLLRQEPGAIYNIRIGFRLDQSLYGGKEPLRSVSALDGKPSPEDEAEWDKQSPYYWDNDYDWSEYKWKDAEDPTKPSYYMDSDRFPYVQLIASDLGLMADYAGGDRLWVAVSDLVSAKPVPGASIEVFDFQLQSIGTGKSDGNGLAEIKISHKPFAVVAKAGGSIAYLKTGIGSERSMSRFDTGGEVIKEGLKAFLYGERGVWRPGDTVHLTMILSDKGKSLPAGHPATLEVYSPSGQFYAKQVKKGTDGFYSFDIPTREDDPTGYWNAYVKVGGSSFHKTLHIETVKANRLKISTSYPDILEAGKNISVKTSADWLTGSPAGSSPARADMTLRRMSGSPFKGFEKYSFNDPSSNFTFAEHKLYDTKLKPSGDISVPITLPEAQGAPGMLRAFIVTSVEESGGDQSFTTLTLPYSPYSSYVGIRLPDGDYLETDKDHSIKIAVLDANGNRVKGHRLEYRIFKTGWNWWWENPGGDLDSYVNGSSVTTVSSGNIVSGTSDSSISFREDYPSWGRYLILVRDTASGHVSGRSFDVDWPEYRGRALRQDPESLTMITLSSDKPVYNAGEKATVYIPAAPGGEALISLENSAGIISREWVSTSDKDTPWTFTVTADMVPNIYVNVTLLQPYGNTVNDLPIRLYGVQRIKVENPEAHLEPVITVPDVIHPEEAFKIKVSEKSGKPMTYTLAIVDEGLLDLTAFKTPDPWTVMAKSEALAVTTWDMYDKVVGAFSGRFTPLASIGGDEDAIRSARKDNRFNPVVVFQGPKTLSKGTDVLTFTLPMYVGSVRVMLVAAHDGSFGSTDKTVPVRNPLMVVTTLPRMVGTGEEFSVPVNVFAMEDGVKGATVTLKAEGPVSIDGNASGKVSFSDGSDKTATFRLKATGEGTATISVVASGNGYKASETLSLPVMNPNPETVSVKRFVLEKDGSIDIPGGPGRTLTIAGFPDIDAKSLYLNMKNYPFECSEQLSARGIAILRLIPLLSPKDAAEARELLPPLVRKLYSRQASDGGFSYWDGGKSDSWVSSMAGLFLSEASKEGIEVSDGVLRSWKRYQKRQTQSFRSSAQNEYTALDEAFRLYTLAVAGDAEISSMNRLKENGKIGDRARWMLASAFAVTGRTAPAKSVLEGIGKQFPEYTPDVLTYGSSLRDRCIAIESLVRTGNVSEAVDLARESLPERYMSTQESAFAAIAFSELYKSVGTAEKSLTSTSVKADTTVVNTTGGPLYGTVVTVSREPVKKAESNGLRLEVKYTDEKGADLNPSSIKQGTRFKAVVKVTNLLAGRALEQIALSMAIPSGWEILNDRLLTGSDAEGYDYKDIRDLRTDWFFALPEGRFKTFTLNLRAAYEGSFVLPAVTCSAMYEPSISASTVTGTAVVVK